MTKKRLLLALALMLTAVGGAWAQGPWTSGSCTVTLNNGVLTVSGNGAMANYQNNSDWPWNDNVNSITSVVVESGVTTIGNRAFMNHPNLTTVTLNEGVTTINENAFYVCGALTTVTIPSTVTSIKGSDVFVSCQAVTDVYLYADPTNLTWPEDGDDFKSNKATQCHVLAEHLAAYQSNFSGVNVTFVGDLQPLAAPLLNWDAATQSGSLTVPAANVTLTVTYYGQYTLDSVPTAPGWQVLVNGTARTVTPYTEGNTALGYVADINETDSVELIPPAALRETIKAVRLTESVAVQNLTISGLVLDITDCTTWEEVVARNTAVIKCPGNHVKRVDNDQSLCYATSGSPVQKTTALDTNADYIWQYAE